MLLPTAAADEHMKQVQAPILTIDGPPICFKNVFGAKYHPALEATDESPATSEKWTVFDGECKEWEVKEDQFLRALRPSKQHSDEGI
ncbi:MAG: hypothetical protein JWN33_313 [Candidatus Saccharibacteria bacterium]|nr:hypothetical protein [Candidatus Saccharibacteria bacterium]